MTHRAGAAAPDPDRRGDHVPAHQDLEGVPGPAQGAEAGPDRVAARTRQGPHVRVRRVRTADDQTGRRHRRGRRAATRAVAGELPQAARLHGSSTPGTRSATTSSPATSSHAKGSAPTLRALQAIRASVDDGEPIHVILDNLNHHKNRALRDWCDDQRRRARVHPDLRVMGQPDRGPLRAAAPVRHRQQRPRRPPRARPSDPRYLRWRNAHTRDPRVLDAERRHRARIRSEAATTMGPPTPRRLTRERSWSEH